MIYSYSISTSPFVVTIEEGGHAIVTQPHHPEAEALKPWPTKKEAETWAKEIIEKLEEGYQQRLIDAETIPDPEPLAEIEDSVSDEPNPEESE